MKSKLSKSLAAALVVAIIAVIAGFWWFTSRDAPEEASLEKAVAGATGSTGADGRSAAESSAVDGTWKLDTTTGGFDYESATGTFVGFRIKEEMARIGSATAVGRTNKVTGSITISNNTLTSGEFTVRMDSITTNDVRRDNKVQSALEIREFPTGSFKLTEPVSLGAKSATGETVKVTARGDLTIHGKTRSVKIPLEAKLTDGTVAVVGSTDVKFSDYGVEVPHSPVVLSVEDHGKIELQMLFTR